MERTTKNNRGRKQGRESKEKATGGCKGAVAEWEKWVKPRASVRVGETIKKDTKHTRGENRRLCGDVHAKRWVEEKERTGGSERTKERAKKPRWFGLAGSGRAVVFFCHA